MNKTALATVIGTTLLGLAKARIGGRNEYKNKGEMPDDYYRPIKIEDIYSLSPQKKAQIAELDLIGKVLGELPSDIFDGFTNLEYLDLRRNQLAEIPQSIGNLTSLTHLNLALNKLTELPDSIGNLTNLTELSLGDNKLTKLPDSIGNLTNLKKLILYENQLREIPQSISNLTNLKKLWLSDNQLTELPDSIGNLTNLEALASDSNNIEMPNRKTLQYWMKNLKPNVFVEIMRQIKKPPSQLRRF